MGNDKDEKDNSLKGPLSNRDFRRRSFFFPGKFETIVDRLIKKGEEEGKFNNLAGEGQPLKIEPDNPYVSEDKKLVYKVLSNAGYSPPWIELGKEVETELEKTQRARREHLTYLRNRLDYIKRGSPDTFFRDLRILAEDHQRWLTTHTKRLHTLNERIHTYNNVCPVQEKHKIPLQVEKLLEEYEKECPAIPVF